MGAMKIEIRQGWNALGMEILFYEERNGKIYVAEPVTLTMKEAEDGIYSGATLTFSHLEGDLFLQNIADVLDSQGIKTDKDAKIQGTLEATRFHLEDLRKLLKLNIKED